MFRRVINHYRTKSSSETLDTLCKMGEGLIKKECIACLEGGNCLTCNDATKCSRCLNDVPLEEDGKCPDITITCNDGQYYDG